MDNYNLKAFRKANNLTQTELGDYLGLHKAFISCIENGRDKFPRPKYEKLLNNPFGWDISMLKTLEQKTATNDKFYDVLITELRKQIERYENKIECLNREIGELKVLLRLSQSKKES